VTTFEEQLRSLMLDAACCSVTRHLERAGHRFIVLKGATIATWLYADPGSRVYKDLDVLVDPEDEDAVVDCLRAIGYEPLLDPATRRANSPEEQPLGNAEGTVIDLHVALKGVRVPPHDAWEILTAETVRWDWAGTSVPALSVPARAMHLALHSAQRGLVDTKAAVDLRLGLERLDLATWEAAAALAGRLDALAAFTAGLRLFPEGARLTDQMSIGVCADMETRLRAGSASGSTLQLERALSATTWGARLAIVRHQLFPSVEWLRMHQPGFTPTTWGILRARAVRPLRVLGGLPRALRERNRYRGGPEVRADQAFGNGSGGRRRGSPTGPVRRRERTHSRR
jgi:hypothetical protein